MYILQSWSAPPCSSVPLPAVLMREDLSRYHAPPTVREQGWQWCKACLWEACSLSRPTGPVWTLLPIYNSPYVLHRRDAAQLWFEGNLRNKHPGYSSVLLLFYISFNILQPQTPNASPASLALHVAISGGSSLRAGALEEKVAQGLF